MISTTQFFKCLSDETRLSIVLLIARQGEMCVCDLMEVLDFSQPKISRHLALLRNCCLLSDERRGQWVYYKLHPALPSWALAIIEQADNSEAASLNTLQSKLQKSTNVTSCC